MRIVHRPFVVFFVAWSLIASPAWARILFDDERSTSSKNGEFYAEPGPGRKSTQVFRQEGPNRATKVWEKTGWSDASFLSDDGEYLAAGDYCTGWLPKKRGRNPTLATFYHRGTTLQSVGLDDVILDTKHLKGRLWGRCVGFLNATRFAIDTVELRRLVFEATTGKLVEVLPGKPISDCN